jgi:hypothetical protein
MKEHEISWWKHVDVCMDGTGPITEKMAEAVAHINTLVPPRFNGHCVLYGQALVKRHK